MSAEVDKLTKQYDKVEIEKLKIAFQDMEPVEPHVRYLKYDENVQLDRYAYGY